MIRMTGKQTSLKEYSFDTTSYVRINDMNEDDFTKYCKAKMKKYEEYRKSSRFRFC